MSIECKRHQGQKCERICASSSCPLEPALCWDCMIDDVDHARNHREAIIKVDEFVSRISKEFVNVVEQRNKTKGEAKEGHLKLAEEGQYYIDAYKYYVHTRKEWVAEVIQNCLDEFSTMCTQLQDEIFKSFDDKIEAFSQQYKYLQETITFRYGLKPLPTEDEIYEAIKENENPNQYIQELKRKLLVPQDLDKNLVFVDTLKDFEQSNELVEQLTREYEERAKEEEEKAVYAKDEAFQDLMRQTKEQMQILVDEVKASLSCKDPILNKNDKLPNLNESLHTINSPDPFNTSLQRTTYAQKLLENSTYANPDEPYNQYLPQTHTHYKAKPDNQQTLPITRSQIRLQKTYQPQHTRGITCLYVLSEKVIALGSKDRKISINYLETPNQNYLLEGHNDQITALCQFSEQMLVSGAGNLDPTLMVWSLNTGKQVGKLVGHQSGITCIGNLKDGQSIVSGSYDNHAIIWNVNTGQAICALRKHTAMISCLTLTQRKDHIITGSWDRSLAIWQIQLDSGRVAGAKYLRDIKADGAVLCLQPFKDRCLFYGGTGNKVTLVDWVTGEVKSKMTTSQFGICELVLTATSIVGLGASDSTLRIWDLNADHEREVKKDQQNIQISNYNASPKMMELHQGVVAVVNNTDQNVRIVFYETI